MQNSNEVLKDLIILYRVKDKNDQLTTSKEKTEQNL